MYPLLCRFVPRRLAGLLTALAYGALLALIVLLWTFPQLEFRYLELPRP